MKKKIVFICIVLALLFFVYPHGVIFVDAAEVVASGACGENLVWELNDEGMLRISGNGAMFNWEGNTLSSAPWYSINDEIKSLVIENGVTSIGNYAFHWCNLMSVILPNSIENIGDSAFKNCCELESIVLQEGVKHIGAETFYGCIKLSDISIPSSVVSMDHNIFEACNALTQIDVSSANPNYCSNNGMLFDKAQTILISYPSATGYVIIPDSVIHIGNTAFYSCEKMTGIAFPDSLLSIGEYAFYSCENLADVKLPDGISTIGDLAFYGCDSISSITIPASITSIGNNVFFDCSSMVYVDVSDDNVFYTDVDGVLYDKTQSTLVWYPEGRSEEIDFSIFSGITNIGERAFSACRAEFDITIPDNIKNIGVEAFWSADITGIFIPETVSDIGEAAFYCCRDLTHVIIEAPITSIGKSMFNECTNLSSIIIPDSITSIGYCAFRECDNLTDVYYTGTEEQWASIEIEDSNESLNNATLHYNYRTYNASFTSDEDGWSFANAAQSFAEEPISGADDYFIPRERYDALFGSSYVDSTDNLYTEEWGGNCAGMSTTAILFFLDSLDWESIDEEYSENFSNPNDFYRSVNFYNQSQSYYPAIGNDTEVTRLIEAYQLYINAIDKSGIVDNLYNTYFATDVEAKSTLFGKEYVVNHLSASEGGTYIASILKEFQKAYDENTPLLIALQADGFGHSIVSRTDLKPEDMGDGWWRVYVYDPNKPYINDSVNSIVSGAEDDPKYTFGCNDLINNGGDIYLELNPSLNQWRYCTSVNSNSTDSYIGSSPSGELLWKTYYHDATPDNENDDGVKKNNAKIPDFFYTIDLTNLTMEDFVNPHFDSTSAWIPENNLAVAVDGNTDCSIYASTGELVAIVEDGDAFVLSDAGRYDAYIGQTKDGGSLGGKIYLPNDVYTVHYTSGAVKFLGNDNALSIFCEGATELTVDIILNSLQLVAHEDGIVSIKCANVVSTDECSYVDTEGVLATEETFTISYSNENKVEAYTDSKNGEFQLYQKNADQDKAVATKVVKSSSLWWLWIIAGLVVSCVVILFVLIRRKKHN